MFCYIMDCKNFLLWCPRQNGRQQQIEPAILWCDSNPLTRAIRHVYLYIDLMASISLFLLYLLEECCHSLQDLILGYIRLVLPTARPLHLTQTYSLYQRILGGWLHKQNKKGFLNNLCKKNSFKGFLIDK